MNEFEQGKMMVIAEMAREIYIQMMSRDIPYANQDTRVTLAEISHNAAVDFMMVHEKWVKSQYPIISQPQPGIIASDFNINGYNSDILLGGDFHA
ncbi:hypothetical protein [Limnospira platensis]|uniref:hypothetical protein n=1 Tax=Limnospira platensis TaxID=118562 RepID=UPI0001D0EEC1|nr:hypothetical protein APPUASWS_014775 [Arthrospira platensis str. Paraca]MDF2213361.1 hypothetical protein [Arthrospira platensis NCB002]QQW27291.1 hypothetical protein AP9108_18635 [Arthrospira sp. PCC 9108]BAI91675.1 hypothetical protein NIES39_K00250 [Arthrospira platensis NIES-39]BDT14012.1 hypothetical protein N39L_37350 [Arthrospira platensis NIES-39]